MAAEYAWQRRHPVPAGTRAGDYQTADTLASLSMGLGSLVAPYVAKRVLDPVTRASGASPRCSSASAPPPAWPRRSATSFATRTPRGRAAGGRHRARRRCARCRTSSPSSGSRRPLHRRTDPGRARTDASLGYARSHGALAVSAVASTALTVATTWAAQTSGKRLFARSRLDLGTEQGRRGGRDPGLGLHLLLEPPAQPREPLAVGGPRGPPLQRALQPLDRAAAAGRRGGHAGRAVRRPGSARASARR